MSNSLYQRCKWRDRRAYTVLCSHDDRLMAFNIERAPRPARQVRLFLRQAWREGSRIRKETIAALAMFPDRVVEGVIVRALGCT